MSNLNGSSLGLEQLGVIDRAVERFDEDCRAAATRGDTLPAWERYLPEGDERLRAKAAFHLRAVEGFHQRGGVTVPGYEIMGWLGRGGIGVVYRARELDTGREVALKLIDGFDSTRAERLRLIWEVEGEVVAGLRHPNIMAVERFGTYEGLVYFVMPVAEGGDLDKRQNKYSLAVPDLTAEEVEARKGRIVALMEKLAGAVHHLHLRAIMHRDLKLSNVLLDENDEPKVCDFDLARRVNETLNVTLSGHAPGTPQYMAPEQMEGRRDLTVRVDIWSLGAILYTLLTGTQPWCEPSGHPNQIERKLREQEPPAPSGLNRRVEIDSDLEWICLRCLQRDPEARPSARELMDWLAACGRGERLPRKGWLSSVLSMVGQTFGQSPVDPGLFDVQRRTLRTEAVTSLLAHAGMGVLALSGVLGAWAWLWFLVMESLLGWAIWAPVFYRRDRSPVEAAASQLWSGADLGAIVLLLSLIRPTEAMTPEALARFYTAYAVLRGLIFYVEGRMCWGRLYVPSLAFYAAAAVMPFVPVAAPFLHGGLYSAAFLWMSCQGSGRAAKPVSKAP